MRGRKQFVRKGIAMCAACAMTVSSLPAVFVYADETNAPEKKLVLHYDFDSLKSGTIVNDISGNGMAGVVRPTGSEVKTESVSIFGKEYTAFVMNGGQPDETHTYVEMPQGILNGLEDVTISCWVYMNSARGSYQRIWDIGSNTTSYMYLIADGANSGHTGYTSALTNSGWSNEKGPEKQTALGTGEWILTTVTFDGSEKTMSLYEDDVLIGTVQTDTDLSVLEGSTQNWIGYGQFQNDIMNGMVADFKIYNYAMTAEEISGQFAIPDEERVQRDADTLSLGNTSAVTADLALPAKGSAGSEITWTSDKPDVIAADGTVTRPAAGLGDAEVILTATIRSGEASLTKQFTVIVKQQLTAEEIAQADAAGIDLGNLNAVTGNLALPSKGTLGSEIIWSSSDESVVAADGTVKRPTGEEKEVTLTATVSYEGETAVREFKVTVMPVYAKNEIKEIKAVETETRIGVLPSLPAQVSVVYADDSTGKEKVVWPTNLRTADFQEAGTKTITGTIVGSDLTVTATVTIVDKAAAAPQKSAAGFDLSDISLDGDDTIFSQNMNRALEYLKIMDADRMLYNFRSTFGVDTKGAQPLTGWDEPTGLLRGHSTGHFMSALALAYATSGDEEYKTKLDYMVSAMRECQDKAQGKPEEFTTQCTPSSAAQSRWSTDPSTWGEGFLSAYSPDQFALLEQYTPYATIWAPYYTLHKLLAGFIDAYNYAGNEEALEVAEGIGTWVYERLSNCTTAEQRTRMWAMYIAGEYGGMNESLARLYEITKEQKYLDAAKMFDNTEFFDGLANNVDTIQNRHANQHIPQIVGAMHEYAASGEAKYYNIAQNFWEMAVSRYTYSIGGVGTGERFKDPYQQGNNILGNSGRGENCETCAAYNMLKVTQELYHYNPDDASYMDYYERTLINQIAASQSHDTNSYMHNGTTYMLPIDPGQRKSYDSDYGGFTCCNGTGMENHVKYQAAAYAHTEDTLYVNLYMPTTVNWDEKNITVKQETKFPSEHSKLTVTGSGAFTMKLRVPYWATEGFTVKVNDEVVAESPEVTTYVAVTRNWADGDVVTIDMPYTLHLDRTPDKVEGSTVASLMYGPIVMVARDTNSSYTAMNWYNIVLSSRLSESVDVVVGADAESVPELTTNGLQFYPMYDAYNYRYHAYVKVDEAGAEVDKSELQALVDSVTGDNALNREEYGPRSWEALQNAIAAAQEALAADPTTQTQVNKALTELQDAIDGLEPAKVIDPDNLEASADADSSYCSSWETLDAVNDGITGSASLGNDCRHWGTWGNWDATEEWVTYSWTKPVEINKSEIYFFDNSNGGDGGVQVPVSYRYEYLNEAGEWAAVSNAQGLGVEQDQFNVTTFDTVRTTSLKVTMVKKADVGGVGINEWKVSGPVAKEPLAFKDVSEEDWFFDSVSYVSEAGIMTGMTEDTFAPGTALSRAQFVTILYRMAGSPEAEHDGKFPDVKIGQFYTDAVAWANENQIVTGYTDTGLFDPDKAISREEMAVMLYRYAKHSGQDITADDDLSTFEDGVSVSEFAKEALSWAVGSKIIRGVDGTLLMPQSSASRAEGAVMIQRYLEDVEK